MLLWASRNEWLGRQFQRRAFARRASRRFLPGEDLESVLSAAEAFRERGITTLVTLLGENVTGRSQAEEVTRAYRSALAAIRNRGVDCLLSVKLTQLGLDVDDELCFEQLGSLLEEARVTGDRVWVDMESSAYVDRTLNLVERSHHEYNNVGVCVQAYLHRTKDDLERLIGLGVPVRLVKGAYNEPPSVAMRKKRDVDAAYLALARRCLEAVAAGQPGPPAFGTHDVNMIEGVREAAGEIGIARDAYEFEMLYGIGRDNQDRLASDGHLMRVLISYGPDWFPWYMRRLAERPANVWFVLKNLFSR